MGRGVRGGTFCARTLRDWPSNLCENNETYVSTTACSTPGYEYGLGSTRVAVLGSGSLFISAVAEFLIGNFLLFGYPDKDRVLYWQLIAPVEL